MEEYQKGQDAARKARVSDWEKKRKHWPHLACLAGPLRGLGKGRPLLRPITGPATQARPHQTLMIILFHFQLNLWRYGDFTEDDAREFGYPAPN